MEYWRKNYKIDNKEFSYFDIFKLFGCYLFGTNGGEAHEIFNKELTDSWNAFETKKPIEQINKEYIDAIEYYLINRGHIVEKIN